MIQCKTISADESYWKIVEKKAQEAGVSTSYLFRSMIEGFLIDHDLIKERDALMPKWVRRSSGHA